MRDITSYNKDWVIFYIQEDNNEQFSYMLILYAVVSLTFIQKTIHQFTCAWCNFLPPPYQLQLHQPEAGALYNSKEVGFEVM